jgi:4'-phosphopantetheinyl transferase
LPEIRYAAEGKPAFCDTTLPHFSISHSGHQVLVAVCQVGEIGADIETLRPRASMLSLAQTLFSQSEYDWFLEQGERQRAAFWQLWTLREALLKQQSRSVWQMASVSIDPLLQHFSGASAPLQLVSAVQADVALALALPLAVTHIEVLQADANGALSPWSAAWRTFLAHH